MNVLQPQVLQLLVAFPIMLGSKELHRHDITGQPIVDMYTCFHPEDYIASTSCSFSRTHVEHIASIVHKFPQLVMPHFSVSMQSPSSIATLCAQASQHGDIA